MKNKLLIILFGISSILNAAKVNNIEISNLKSLPEDFVRQMLPVSKGVEYTNKLSNDIYLYLVRSGFIQNVNVYPTLNGENVDLKLVVDEIPNAEQVYANYKELEALKQKSDFNIGEIKISGTTQDLSSFISKTGLKKGAIFVPYDAKLLESLLLSTGYFSSAEIFVTRTANEKVIDVEIKAVENPRITAINIKGATLISQSEAILHSGLKVGDILNTNLLTLEGSPLLKTYVDNGILWVGFKDIEVTKEGVVNIELSEGIVSDVIYEKKGVVKESERISDKDYKLKTQDFVLSRNTYIEKGKVLTKLGLETTLSELFRTGLFSNLSHEITRDKNNPENLVVKIIVTERPTTAISANLSYSTEDSFTGSLKLSDSNFLGKEQSIDITGEAGLKGNYNISLSYKDPWIEGTDRILFGGSAYFKKTTASVKDLDVYKKDPSQDIKTLENSLYMDPTDRQFVFGINTQIGKGLTRDIYLTLTPRLLNVNSKNKVEDEKARVFQDYTLAAVGTNLVYDTRDDRNTPKKGLYADLYLEGGYIFRENSLVFGENKLPIKDESGEYIKQATRAYATTTLDLRAYHPVYEDKNSMAYRILTNYSHANTPSGQLSVVGDGLTLRGLQNAVSGNKFSMVFTAENRTYINDYVQAVLFYDGGLAEKVVKQDGSYKFVNNVGLGARINTPMGLVRLDYAWDLEKDANNQIKGKFNFGFGQTF